MTNIRLRLHPENHLVSRIGWLRAAVLGANDGIVSTASLIVGVAAAAATRNDVLLAGVAGLVAGAMSMAAGEYVSVSSQSDTEQADLARERKELSENVEFEREELADIYVKRGVEQDLARQVAEQLMAKDALTAHARDELGISEITTARPVQAALTSAATFAVGAAMPLLMVVVAPASALVPIVSGLPWAFSLSWVRSAPKQAVQTSCVPPPGSHSGVRWPWHSLPSSGNYSARLSDDRDRATNTRETFLRPQTDVLAKPRRNAWQFAPKGAPFMRATDPAVTFVLILVIGIVAGILLDRLAGPSWLTRQFTGSTRGMVTSALVGVAGAFVGYHIAVLLALGGGLVTTVIAAAAGAAVLLFAWRMVK